MYLGCQILDDDAGESDILLHMLLHPDARIPMFLITVEKEKAEIEEVKRRSCSF